LEIELRSVLLLCRIFLIVTVINCQSVLAFATAPSTPLVKTQTTDSLPEVVRQTLALHFGESTDYESFDELAHSFVIPKNCGAIRNAEQKRQNKSLLGFNESSIS
jgi:hypothetical protein